MAKAAVRIEDVYFWRKDVRLVYVADCFVAVMVKRVVWHWMLFGHSSHGRSVTLKEANSNCLKALKLAGYLK